MPIAQFIDHQSQHRRVHLMTLQAGDRVPDFSLQGVDGSEWKLSDHEQRSSLLIFFETDCPTCQLALPYLSRLADALQEDAHSLVGISQDSQQVTEALLKDLPLSFPVTVDENLEVSRLFDPQAVPTLALLDQNRKLVHMEAGFDKQVLNDIAGWILKACGKDEFTLAEPFDGAPNQKPGCLSRHLEGDAADSVESLPAPAFLSSIGSFASRIEVDEDKDIHEYCMELSRDPLPVVPPTSTRVDRMLSMTSLSPNHIVASVPPNYGHATVEKIAANAVMAGCKPEMMRCLIPAVRAACDERFNLHGVQATTHFATPMMIVNGPIREELGFACGSNVFSNLARSNSTLGRAMQLIFTNLGGARPGEIDMSTLGNAGKFSSCIAENEEENPWEPLHVARGFSAEQSAITLFAAEPPRGVSEHTAVSGREVLRTITFALVTVWSYRVCGAMSALVVLCPEHVKTIQREGWSRQDIRQFLYDHTGVPVRVFHEENAEGKQWSQFRDEIEIDGVTCYRKFASPEDIEILVAGGTAGKFSAVPGSWAKGPRGSQMVTYPIE